jgi:hypothetical protein
MTPQQLDDAIDQLAPAEACRAYDHPNLAAWQTVRGALTDRRLQTIVAVFDDDAEAGSSDPYVQALRRGG